MRPLPLAVLLLAAPAAALAVAPDRALSVEAAVLTPFSRGRPPAAAVSIGAATWLEGPLEATATLTWAAAPRTSGRAADLAAAAGLRATAGRGLRVSLWAEAGAEPGEGGRVRGTFGGGAGVAAGRGRLALVARAGLRRGAWGARAELRLGLEAGF